MDTELFDLCKAVYEKTGWMKYFDWHFNEDGQIKRTIEGAVFTGVPLYTSDYLLEKLPMRTSRIEDTAMLGRATDNNGWSVVYRDNAYLADTPLKALLKLTLALEDTEHAN